VVVLRATDTLSSMLRRIQNFDQSFDVELGAGRTHDTGGVGQFLVDESRGSDMFRPIATTDLDDHEIDS
jgi:hypothetical protein